MSEKKNRQDSTVGRNNPGRDAIGAAMRFITSITGSDFAQKYDLQPTIDRVIYQSTKSGFKTLGAANRQFKKVSGSGKPQRPARDAQAAAPDDAARLTAAAVELGTREGVDVLRGKDVVELAVLDVDKGSALADLRAQVGAAGLLYAGDDVTDERAFAALGPDDVTVKVGDGATAARFRVPAPAEVAAALHRLADLLGA